MPGTVTVMYDRINSIANGTTFSFVVVNIITLATELAKICSIPYSYQLQPSVLPSTVQFDSVSSILPSPPQVLVLTPLDAALPAVAYHSIVGAVLTDSARCNLATS